MHIVEMKWWITNMGKRLRQALMNALPEYCRHGIVGRALDKTFHLLNALVKACLNCYDRIHFGASHPASDSDPVAQETAKLVHSWSTFSDDYLKCHHGQDYNHPSRVFVRKMIQDIIDGNDVKCHTLKLLDVPCGNGTDYEYIFSNLPLEYEGLELNPKQVKLNRERLLGGNFQIGDIMGLKAPDCSYDIVYCRHIFEHLSLDAMDLALKETYRVARKFLLYVFFSMEDIPEHKEIPVRLYHCNVLSKRRIEQRLRSFERVKDIQVTRISEVNDKEVIEAFSNPQQNNYVFLVILEENVGGE